MIPTVEERLDSVIRALSTVVMTSLPLEAKLAREQVQLSIGHLGILRDQIAVIPQFEGEELDDAAEMAAELLIYANGGAATLAARACLNQALSDRAGMPATLACRKINSAISNLVEAVFLDGDSSSRSNVMGSVTRHERLRSNKDREMFKPYGFDSL